jgi:hypothetical protein
MWLNDNNQNYIFCEIQTPTHLIVVSISVWKSGKYKCL